MTYQPSPVLQYDCIGGRRILNQLGLTSKFFVKSSPEVWRDARNAGFETAELVFPSDMSIKPMFEEAAKRRSDILSVGLEILSAHTPFGPMTDPSSANTAQRRLAMETEKTVLDQISNWEIGIAVLHASFEPIGEDERAARMEIARDAIAELGEYARTRGVTLAVEVLPRTCLGNCSEEILYLTDHGRLAKVNLDFNHLLKESHASFIEAAAPYIVTTHVSDYDFVDEKHWMPGIGKIDWKNVIGCIRKHGYNGQFMFETYEDRAIPGKKCTPRMIIDTWRRLMSEEKE